MARQIIHFDMDAFYAAVEARDNPSLFGKPVIVGSLPTDPRGVVATCSYEARKYGVHSAMSIREAYKKCPHGIYLRPRMAVYAQVSQGIRSICERYTPVTEYLSYDEGFLDMTDHEASASHIAMDFKKAIKNELGLTCSVGVGYSKMSAKLASEEKKPNGYYAIETADALINLIRYRSVRVIWGVGKQTATSLEKIGIRTIDDVLKNETRVIGFLKNRGSEIVQLAKGIDHRRVVPFTERKSIGEENTFPIDLEGIEEIEGILQTFAQSLSDQLKRKRIYAKTITLKVTYAGMRSITRSFTGIETNDATEIFIRANRLLDKIERKPIRLMGISASGLTEVKPLTIFDL